MQTVNLVKSDTQVVVTIAHIVVQGSIECTNNTDWSFCPEPSIVADIFLSEPKKIRWIKLTGLEVCIGGGHAGFRELLFMGKLAL